jgi:decaprenyl-phosphate phosphoribosyltransferase
MSAPTPDSPRPATELAPLKLVGSDGAAPPPEESGRRTPGAEPDTRSIVTGLIQTVRPHQWVKNLFVVAPIFFAKDVVTTTAGGDPALNLHLTGRALGATAIFCLLAGAVYTINDLVDVEADRVHPVKRHRPIASGVVPEPLARAAAAGLVVMSLSLGYLITPWLALVAAIYFTENLLYSFKLKKVAFVDVSMIAAGFVLRVWAGGIATPVRVSFYMYACTALLALFLGFGKRRHELAQEHASKQRAALKAYSAASLTVALAITGSATIVTYLAYTIDRATEAFFQSKNLWLTTPFVVFGIARFLFLVTGRAGRGAKAESPTQEMLRDVPFVLNLVAWAVVVVAIVYRLRPGT